jgi:hypothetical protein
MKGEAMKLTINLKRWLRRVRAARGRVSGGNSVLLRIRGQQLTVRVAKHNDHYYLALDTPELTDASNGYTINPQYETVDDWDTPETPADELTEAERTALIEAARVVVDAEYEAYLVEATARDRRHELLMTELRKPPVAAPFPDPDEDGRGVWWEYDETGERELIH